MAQLTLSLGMLAMAFFTVTYGGFVRPLRAQARSPGRFGAVHLRGSQLFCKERELLILNDNPFLDRRRLLHESRRTLGCGLLLFGLDGLLNIP